MGTKLSTASQELKKTPLVNVRGEKGEYFIGVLVGSRAVKSSFKNEDGSDKVQNVYEFAPEDTDMGIVIKDEGAKEYRAATEAECETVGIFAPTKLNNALKQAEKNMRLKITYLGLGKAAKKGGRPHEYDVEII